MTATLGALKRMPVLVCSRLGNLPLVKLAPLITPSLIYLVRQWVRISHRDRLQKTQPICRAASRDETESAFSSAFPAQTFTRMVISPCFAFDH